MRILTATEWGRRLNGTLQPMPRPATYWIIHHTAGPWDRPLADELRIVNEDSIREGKTAIDYSFAVTRDGELGEGRGWAVIGAHTGATIQAGLPRSGESYNVAGHALVFIGNYHPDFTPVPAVQPTRAQLDAAAWILAEGVRLGHVTPDFQTIGHRQAKPTACPGDLLYPKVPGLHTAAHALLEGDEIDMATIAELRDAIRDEIAAAGLVTRAELDAAVKKGFADDRVHLATKFGVNDRRSALIKAAAIGSGNSPA